MTHDVPGPEDRLTLAAAIAMIAERDMRPNDDLRGAKARTRHRIETAVTKGKLRQEEGDVLRASSLGTWLKEVFPGKFDDWPSDVINITVKLTGVSARGISGDMHFSLLPPDLTGCHQLILSTRAQLADATARIAILEAENERLRKIADRNAQRVATNRENGKKGGRPRT